MNRREMFKKIIGVVAVGAVGPKVLEAANGDVPVGNDYPGIPIGAPPAYVPPPPDLRTPEQIWADQVNREVFRYLSPNQFVYDNKRYISFTQPAVYRRVKAILAEQDKLELITLDDKECINLPHCVLTVW